MSGRPGERTVAGDEWCFERFGEGDVHRVVCGDVASQLPRTTQEIEVAVTMEIEAVRSAIASSARPEETSPARTRRRRPRAISTSRRCGACSSASSPKMRSSTRAPSEVCRRSSSRAEVDDYDIHPDGRTLVVVRPSNRTQGPEITVVVDAFAERPRKSQGGS